MLESLNKIKEELRQEILEQIRRELPNPVTLAEQLKHSIGPNLAAMQEMSRALETTSAQMEVALKRVIEESSQRVATGLQQIAGDMDAKIQTSIQEMRDFKSAKGPIEEVLEQLDAKQAVIRRDMENIMDRLWQQQMDKLQFQMSTMLEEVVKANAAKILIWCLMGLFRRREK